MIRAVLDTNVIVSALLFRGEACRVHAAWKAGRLTLLVTGDILAEYVRVLAYPKFGLDEGTVQAILDTEVLPYCEVVRLEGVVSEQGRCRDPDDEKLLTCAIAGHADVLVTGDDDLLSIRGEVVGVTIVTVAALLAEFDR